MKVSTFLLAALFIFAGCSKLAESLAEQIQDQPSGKSILYTIPAGQHYSLQNGYALFKASALSFTVKFDSSCIYQSMNTENQSDINKLYGFSDNNSSHHEYSARFGWRWSDHQLRLFAYVYNEGQVESREITSIPIGSEMNCSIQVLTDSYIFSVDEKVIQIPRKSKTEIAQGYRLYPYFGGNEPAPHEIRIWIREL